MPAGDGEVRRVLVLGAGAIGLEIASQCACHGLPVTVYDVDAGVVAGGPGRLCRLFQEMTWAAPPDPQAAAALVTFTVDPQEAAAGVDLVSECVPEQLPLKRQVLADFEPRLPPHAVLTTTSSYFLPSMLVAALARRERFAALHFHSPVWSAAVADIMPHPQTAPECVAVLERFARRIGQIPIVLKREHHGYVFNSMLRVLLMAALTLAERDVVGPEDIDRAWMGVTKMPVGPFGMLDRIGLETVRDIARYWGGVMRDPQVVRNGDYLQRLIDAGRTGRRAGRGFYLHPDPAYEAAGFLAGVTAAGGQMPRAATAVPRAAVLPVTPAGADGPPPLARCELIAIPAPLPAGGDPRDSLAGTVVLHGANPLTAALARRLGVLGLTVIELPTEIAAAEPLLAAAAQSTAPCHLMLVAGWSAAVAPLPTAADWPAMRRPAVDDTYAVCQAWYRHAVGQPWLGRAAVVAATALGGDLGGSGRIVAAAGGGVAGLLKAVYMESRAAGLTGPAVRIVDAAAGDTADRVAERLVAEMAHAVSLEQATAEKGYTHLEVGYRRGVRHALRLQPSAVAASAGRISRGGQWVVTGGARGITAEVARRLAVRFGLRLIVLGTTSPGDEPLEQLAPDAVEALKRDVMIRARAEGRKPNEAWDAVMRVIEVRRTLAAYREAGVEATYHVCPADDGAAVTRVLAAARAAGGPIHGLLHGAGFERTGRFERTSRDEFLRTLAGKVDGLVTLLDALADDPLEAVVAFGSLSGRCGGVGQTAYALANDLLAKLVTRYRQDPRGTAAATIHWPGWDDVGMAARPASRRALEAGRQRFLSVEEGCRHAIDEIAAGLPAAEVVILDPDVLPAGMVIR
jgi:3-hydroxyacyl-CoA dehydrogenase